MRNLNWIIALMFPVLLTACFEGETKLIPAGEAVLPIDGPIRVCLEEAEPCFEMQVSGDGYFTDALPDEEGGATLRFAPLTQASDRQIYILEATPDEGGGVILAVARRSFAETSHGASFDIAAVECSKLSDEAEQAFEAAGGYKRSGFLTTCVSPNLEAIRAAFMTGFQPHFGDEDWWFENGLE